MDRSQLAKTLVILIAVTPLAALFPPALLIPLVYAVRQVSGNHGPEARQRRAYEADDQLSAQRMAYARQYGA